MRLTDGNAQIHSGGINTERNTPNLQSGGGGTDVDVGNAPAGNMHGDACSFGSYFTPPPTFGRLAHIPIQPGSRWLQP